MKPTTSYRLGLAITIGTLLMLVWSAGALGIIGDGGRPDLMYVGVLVVCLAGAAIALAAGMQDDPGASVAEILGVNAMFVALFALSAWLIGRAAEDRRTEVRGSV